MQYGLNSAGHTMHMTKVKVSDKVRYSYNQSGLSYPWAWCVDNLGIPVREEDRRWSWDTYKTFYFRDEADAIMFVLNFGSDE